MRAGALKRQVWLDEPTTSQNETGEEVVTFTPFAQVPASINPLRGREALIAGANLSIMDTKIVIRWSPQTAVVTSKWRARYGSTVYDVVSASNVKTDRREIELLCKSGASNG
jgi:SPP1 family predicted phage head-tail adaptor